MIVLSMIFNMRGICLSLSVILCFLVSCRNQAEPVQTPPPQTAQTPPASERPSEPVRPVQQQTGEKTEVPQRPVFDPSSISQEEKDTTKIEIQHLIQRLNNIIRAKNFNAWVSYLSSDYFAVISSAEYLDRISQSTVLKKQKIVLKSAQDYFNYVVVPARANDRVDEIEFESQNRVKAYTLNSRGERLRLYDLEKTGNEWKIIN